MKIGGFSYPFFPKGRRLVAGKGWKQCDLLNRMPERAPSVHSDLRTDDILRVTAEYVPDACRRDYLFWLLWAPARTRLPDPEVSQVSLAIHRHEDHRWVKNGPSTTAKSAMFVVDRWFLRGHWPTSVFETVLLGILKPMAKKGVTRVGLGGLFWGRIRNVVSLQLSIHPRLVWRTGLTGGLYRARWPLQGVPVGKSPTRPMVRTGILLPWNQTDAGHFCFVVVVLS